MGSVKFSSTKFSLVVSRRIAVPQHRQNFRLDRSHDQTTLQIILTWAGPSCDHEGKGSRSEAPGVSLNNNNILLLLRVKLNEGKGSRSEAAHLHFEPADDLRLRYA